MKGSAADILLLLDCCYAAQAGRERDASWARLEILAAAAMGMKTPGPGPQSFTRALINELKACVEKDEYLGIDDLHRRLVSRKANLHATPIRISLSSGKRPLRLYPLSKVQLPYSTTNREGIIYQILFQTDTVLEKTHIDAIAAWLGEDKPVAVTAVGVQQILQVTSQLRQVMDSLDRQEQPLAKVVEPPDVKNIAAAWNRIVATIDHHSNQQSLQSEVHLIRKEQVRSFLEHLDFHNEEMASTVRRAVMNSASMADLKMLNEAVEDPAFDLLGIADQLRLRKMVHTDFVDVSKCQNSRDPYNKTTVLHEFKNYGSYVNPAEMPELTARVANLAALLHASKSRDFLSLPCSRWYEETLQDRFVLEFEIPTEYDATQEKCYSLQSLIRDLKGSERPSLNTRLKLACSLAKAIEQWHAVDWLHQGISSINVLFLKRKSTKQIDYSFPILQGFEYARPKTDPSIGRSLDDIAFNVYRHPQRQGVTRKGHTKIHDLYSLGVVLLEIGLWQTALDIFRPKKNVSPSPAEIQQKFQSACSERLAHYAGESFRDSVSVCLASSFDITMEDSAESNLARAFQKMVVDRLANGVTLSGA